MEPLTWTGSLSVLVPVLLTAAAVWLIAAILRIVLALFLAENQPEVQPDGTLAATRGPLEMVGTVAQWAFLAVLGVVALFVLGGVVLGTGGGILGAVARRFLPVWIALIATFALSIRYKRRLGLYGKLFDSTIGMVGFAIVLFWVFTAICAGLRPRGHARRAPADLDAEERAARRAAARGRGGLSLLPPGRRQPRARRVQPRGLRLADRDADRALRHALRLHGRHHAGACLRATTAAGSTPS